MFRRNGGESISRVAQWQEDRGGGVAHAPYVCELPDHDLQKATPVVGDLHLDIKGVPALACQWKQDSGKSVFKSDAEGTAAVQFRLMRRRLTNMFPDGGVLLITSPASGDGKSFTAHNLAWAFAEAGSLTLLLDMDLRRPAQASQLGVSPLFGTDDVLAGRATPHQAVRRLEDLPLGFIGLNHAAHDPVRLIRSPYMSQLLSWARDSFTWVVIDTPPVLPVADVGELLPNVDLVALVVRERVTSGRLVERAAERLENRLSFMILNESTLSPDDGYQY